MCNLKCFSIPFAKHGATNSCDCLKPKCQQPDRPEDKWGISDSPHKKAAHMSLRQNPKSERSADAEPNRGDTQPLTAARTPTQVRSSLNNRSAKAGRL